MRSVAFYTLGCKLNFSETSTISRMLEGRGYRRAEFTDGADIYIINTCSVTDNADKKCRKVVKEALRHNPEAYIAIIGCYAQLKPEEITRIPGVDAVLGAKEKFRLPELLDGFRKTGSAQIFNSPIAEADAFHSAYSLNDRTRTFLKVQDGCDYNCSFCTIPLARGSSRSDYVANIVENARQIAASGVREVVLTGVNIGDFGLHNGQREESFLDLVKALDEVEGIDRFRISSIEPNLLRDEVIEFAAGSKRFVPHFHIPLQSGSNKVLAAMRRRYKRELYADRVARIKELMPHCCIGVDVIVGFPGETDELFNETVEFLKSLDVSYFHVFTYSERANTHALTLPGSVPGSKRADRSKVLHLLSDKKRRHFYEQHLGSQQTVLFEAETDGLQMFGFTENYVKVVADYDPLLVNELVPVQLAGINADGLATVEVREEVLAH